MSAESKISPPASPIDEDFPLTEAQEVWSAIQNDYEELVNAKTTFKYEERYAIYLTIYELSEKRMKKDRFKEEDRIKKHNILDHIAEKGLHQLIALKHIEPVPLDIVRSKGRKIDRSRWPGKEPRSAYYVIKGSPYSEEDLLKLADMLSEITWSLDLKSAMALAKHAHDLSAFGHMVFAKFYGHTQGEYGPGRHRFAPESLMRKIEDAKREKDEDNKEEGGESANGDE